MHGEQNSEDRAEVYSFRKQLIFNFTVSLIAAGVLFWMLDEHEDNFRLILSAASLFICFIFGLIESTYIEYLILTGVLVIVTFVAQKIEIFPYYPVITACIVGAIIGAGGRAGRGIN